jgi:hypothetical protein
LKSNERRQREKLGRDHPSKGRKGGREGEERKKKKNY